MCDFFMDKKAIQSKIVDKTGLPKDVVFGVPLVNIIGHTEASIENYRGILEYTDKLIRVQTKFGKIHINGSSLAIKYYTNEEMKVTGEIKTIEFFSGGE